MGGDAIIQKEKMNKKVYQRIGFSDIVIENEDKCPKYIKIIDENGKNLGEIQAYHVDFELENGDACDEDGNKH